MVSYPHEFGIPGLEPQPRIFVLIEEDDDLRELLASYLGSRGVRVLALKEPPARDDLARLRPDVILLDLIYHGEPRGLLLLTQGYRDLGSTIVVLTGAAELVSARQDEIKEVASCILLKPFELDELDAAVDFPPERIHSKIPNITIIELGSSSNDEL